MNEKPFFSVIIPTYNRAHLILRTIESVIQQRFADHEIIVVDNLSTDNTRDVLAPLIASKTIRFIQHDKNYERALSRNTGMSHARGNFVTFLDSDDVIYPGALESAYAFAQENNEYKIFHSLYELINEDMKPLYRYRFPPIENATRAIARGNFLSCICVFIEREIFTSFAFDTREELQGIEDWEYWLRILATYPVGRINKIYGGIIHHPGRSTTQYDLETYVIKKDYVLKKFRKDPFLSKIYSPHLTTFECSCYMLAASQANTAGFYSLARKYLKEAILRKPGLIIDLRFLRILQISFMRIKSKI
ncbi:MAG: glycosyltransferase family A protein [Cytophagales bacterium]|nr:glycosyltransferase family A protein [Cytophagales bacterium]